MTLTLIPPTVRPSASPTSPPSWWARHEEHKRLAELDRRLAHVAELYEIRTLLATARDVVEGGWIQHAWFRYRSRSGAERTITAYSAPRSDDEVVSGACLVGAVVEAGGGLPAARTQLVQRSLDLTWHTLYENRRQPVRWCPAPPIRALHLRDLTAWNDRDGRRQSDVLALLTAAEQTADAELTRLRAG